MKRIPFPLSKSKNRSVMSEVALTHGHPDHATDWARAQQTPPYFRAKAKISLQSSIMGR
jgi:hypothetical protein